MYAEDQDEDVEEEEEFHEVEEEKHKTSQESVGTSEEQKSNQSPTDVTKSATVSEDNKEQTEKLDHDVCNDTQPKDQNISEDDVDTSCAAKDHFNSVTASQQSSLDSTQPETPSKDETTGARHDIGNSSEVDKKSSCDEAKSSEQVSTPKTAIDWANIMMHNKSSDSESAEETSSSDKVEIDDCEKLTAVVDSKAEDTIDGIIEDTQLKLKIADDSNDISESSAKAPSENDPIPLDRTDAEPIPSVSQTVDPVLEKVDPAQPEADGDKDQKSGDEEQKVGDEDQEKVNEVEKKELDLDEDVKNPQYIPKKGVFYEHDDRSHDTDQKKSPTTTKEDDNAESKEISASKKTSGGEKPADNRRTSRRQRTDADRWGHDLFRNEKQKPKSKSELINAYGYDIRQERGARNQTESRAPRTNNNNNSNSERPSGNQDGQRSRQSRDARGPRQIQQSANSGSRERKPRHQNVRNGRGETYQGTPNRRDGQINRSAKVENTKDLRETLDEKHAAQAAAAAASSSRRDRDGSGSNRNARNDSRGRRRTSRDRPNVEDVRLPPPNSIMPPITTWSSEDMMIAEAFGKKSPPQADVEPTPNTNKSNTTNVQRDRLVDGWQQGPPSKPFHQERPTRGQEENRPQQNYNTRRYQDRGDEIHRPTQFTQRNQYHDRPNQQHEWHRAGNFSPYAKSNDYVVKTQTFENSRLSQANQNRSNNNRDLREVINERRGNNQQNIQPKVQHNADHLNHRGQVSGHYHHQYTSTQQYMPPHNQQMVQGQSHVSHQPHHQQAMAQNPMRQPQRPDQQSPHQIQTASNHNQHQQQHQQQQHQQNSHAQPARQPPTMQPAQPPAGQSRQNVPLNNVSDNSSENIRLNATNANDPMNSRPIVKTDAYTGASLPGLQQHSQPLSQHSQNHRSVARPLAQPAGAVPASSHIVPSHLGTTATQYYQPSSGSRDPTAAAALASAYHGYMHSGHPVMDPSRYHMTSQQLSDHGYLAPGQTNDVAAGNVLHQQGLYTDTSDAGAMANAAYLAQAGSSLSPTTSIPVTGAGSQPLAPVSYIQHSQYPPPPYSNPYPQPQMNQPPPQSGHAYPYWTYI